MNLYTPEQCAFIADHHFAFILIQIEEHVLTITLNRSKSKNALHPQMVNEIAFALHFAHYNSSIWMIVFQAEGDVFCAGADLKAMMGMIEEHDSTIPLPSSSEVLIGELFNKVNKPMIAKVTGDVYAGGFFFLAGCQIVVAQTGIKLGLPEVKRGLFPFQVMAALMRVMPHRRVLDWCIRGYNLSVEEAASYGLITQVCNGEEIDLAVQKIVEELMANSPSAIKYGLQAYDKIHPSADLHQYLYEMLQKTIASKDGQEGLTAFRQKRKPNWTGE